MPVRMQVYRDADCGKKVECDESSAVYFRETYLQEMCAALGVKYLESVLANT